MSNLPTAKMRRRASFVIFTVLLFFAVALIIKLFTTSVMDNARYQELANSYHFGSISISANRGTIYAADDKVLAQSATVFKVYMDPSLFNKQLTAYDEDQQAKIKEQIAKGETPDTYKDTETVKKEIVTFLAQKLEIEEQKIYDAIEANTQYQVLQTQVEKPIADEITGYMTKLGFSSVSTEQDTKRYYPQGDLASSVIGFINSEGDGLYGIEAQYDEYLAGTDGKTISAKDANGDEMPYKYSKTYAAQPGKSVYLTIDSTLQYYLQKNLDNMNTEFKLAERACGIIMNAKTGAILAMATTPSYDLNDPYTIVDKEAATKINALTGDEYNDAYWTEVYSQWSNKAVSEIYIPGSVFKVITSSSALEENVITPQTTFNCPGYADVSGTKIKCWKTSGHGTQDFYTALTNSCNPAFIEIGRRLGSNLFFQYFKAYGLTEKTGIDLPAEATSYYQDLEGMGPVELASCSFGQTNKLTPIEMITAYAAVINGGNLLTPYVVDKVVDDEGNVVLQNTKQVKRQVISEDTSATMRDALETVVNNNGGSNAYIKGYRIGGKSGTSEKLDMYVSSDDKDTMRYVSSYVCFAPANDPEIIMLIMADEPMSGQYYGSVVAVPCARNILQEALPYLGYYPEYTDAEIATLDVAVPLLTDKSIDNAKATLVENDLEYEVVGEGTTVLAQVPTVGSSISHGGKVILYTEQNYTEEMVTVPDVSNMTLTDANYTMTQNGLNFTTTGASTDRADSVVSAQSYAVGTKVPKGTVVELTFSVYDRTG